MVTISGTQLLEDVLIIEELITINILENKLTLLLSGMPRCTTMATKS